MSEEGGGQYAMVNGDGEPIEVPVEEPVEVSEGIPLKRRAGRPPGSRNSSSMISYALSITQIPLNSATKNGKDLQLKSAEMTSPSRPTGRNKRSAGPLASSTPKRKGRPAGVKDNTPRFRSTSKLIFPDVDFSSVLSEREGAAISGSHRNKRVPSFMMRQKSGQKKKLEMARDPAGNNEISIDADFEKGEWDESVFLVADKILRSQVDFLVEKAGASSNFRQVVQQLWFSYLTIALPDVSHGVEAAILKDMDWLNSLRQPDFCSLMDCKSKELNTILKVWKHESALQQDAALDDPDHDDRRSGQKQSRGERRKTGFNPLELNSTVVRADYVSRAPERLTISRIVAFIVMGLYICEERILISDLLRWIRVMYFPFMDLSSGESTNLSRSEVATSEMLFAKSRLISFPQIEFHVSVVAKLLNMGAKDLPAQNVVPVVERFIEELNLPRKLIPFVTEFLDAVNSLDHTLDLKLSSATYSKHRATNVEALVMASILYSLRLLFGLDGIAERDIHRETKALRELLDGPELFDFHEWCAYIQYRRLALFRHSHTFFPASVSATFSFIGDNLQPGEFHGPYELNAGNLLTLSYENLQRSFQRLELPSNEQDEMNIILPPNLRPFRSHSAVLGDHYPSLLQEFDSFSLSHLTPTVKTKDRHSLPTDWKMNDDEMTPDALGHLGRIKAAQAAAFHDSYPVRAYNIRGCTVEPSLDFVQSESLKFLIEIAAEMIEQQPESLLGEVMYLEMALYPRNPDCRWTGGKAFSAVQKLRHGQ